MSVNGFGRDSSPTAVLSLQAVLDSASSAKTGQKDGTRERSGSSGPYTIERGPRLGLCLMQWLAGRVQC